MALRVLADTAPRVRHGVLEFPVHHMRGGTSTGVVIWEPHAPTDVALREELLRHLMGVPLSGRDPTNRQTTGLGRGPATSNKAFFVRTEPAGDGVRLVSTLGQLASDHDGVDWAVGCGNMSAALPLWALDVGLIPWPAGTATIDIRNTNTGGVLTARVAGDGAGGLAVAEIPGVAGAFPAVDLFLHSPVGAKTGQLLPTGAATDVVAGTTVSCVDVAVPMVIARAADFGKTALEPVAELASDAPFLARLREIWVGAGLLMGLRRRDGQPMTAADLAVSETVPKVCIVGPPAGDGHIAVRYFTPQTVHGSMAVSGGCCLAAATLIPGTVAHAVARGVAAPGAAFTDVDVAIENPAGVLGTTIVARNTGAGPEIRSAAYRRSAQVLVQGYVPLYRASAALRAALAP
ncbi:PrpF protein [Dipodascopsis tothii]|uniref:PrpF protein n=1 Tax=Dipodascopsis tothii TaxID=44089 RepID=UPI0034CFE9DF